MNILIIGPANPYRGGISALNERLAVQLTQEGHKVEIINFKLQYPGFLFPGKTQYSDTLPPKGLVIKRMINSINPFNWIATGLKLKKKKAEMVIVRYWIPLMSPSTGTICRILKSNGKTKIISIVDNIIPHEHRLGDSILTKYFAGAVDGFITMSDCVFNDIDLFSKRKPKALTPHPIYDHYGEIIPVKEALNKLNLNENYQYILFFGFIRDYKGLDILLNAMANEKVRSLDVKLIIAGEFYSNEKYYLELISSLKIEESVIMKTDFIPDDEVNKYFCAANLIAQPYKSATQSGVTQIGYHFSKPMLVTNVGGLAEIIENGVCGYVVEPDPIQVSEAIYDFFKNKREADMTRNVIIAKEKFSWNNMTTTIFNIYKQIIK